MSHPWQVGWRMMKISNWTNPRKIPEVRCDWFLDAMWLLRTTRMSALGSNAHHTCLKEASFINRLVEGIQRVITYTGVIVKGSSLQMFYQHTMSMCIFSQVKDRHEAAFQWRQIWHTKICWQPTFEISQIYDFVGSTQIWWEHTRIFSSGFSPSMLKKQQSERRGSHAITGRGPRGKIRMILMVNPNYEVGL